MQHRNRKNHRNIGLASPRRPFRRDTGTRGSAAGFTLIEVMVTASVLLVGLLAMTSTSVVVNSLRRSASDQQVAQSAMQAIVEDLHAAARSADSAASNWAGDVIDVYGPGGMPGDSFPIQGLDPWTGQANVASVELITDETSSDAGLGVAAGMPRDLDGDGTAANVDTRGTAALLPAIVRVQWRGAAGQQQLTQVVYLLRY